MKAKIKPCRAMKGLVEEGQEVMGEEREDARLDCALVGAARRVEHYEMAGYLTAICLAQRMKEKEVVDLLKQTLAEEQGAEKKLRKIAATLINSAPNAA